MEMPYLAKTVHQPPCRGRAARAPQRCSSSARIDQAAIDRTRPDAVINELTSLPRHYTAAEMQATAERDRKVRIEGNANLLAALQDTGECRSGAPRSIKESSRRHLA
jgi:hypothetical protein